MKKVLCCLAFVGLLGFALAGCEKGKAPSGGGPAVSEMLVASQIDDGAPKFEPGQSVCYVTNKPIKAEFYTDYNGKRIYFSSQEAVAEFNKNPQKYLPPGLR